jgi:hypothetical protein
MKITRIKIAIGEIVPPFYYGLSYGYYERDIEIWHIIPINYIIRWLRDLKYFWDKIRSKPSIVDKIIQDKISQIQREEEEYWRDYWERHFIEMYNALPTEKDHLNKYHQ